PLTGSRAPARPASKAASALGRTGSPRLEDLQQRVEIVRMRLEIFSNGPQLLMEPGDDPCLQILRMEFRARVGLGENVEGVVYDIPAELRVAGDHQPLPPREEDQPR